MAAFHGTLEAVEDKRQHHGDCGCDTQSVFRRRNSTYSEDAENLMVYQPNKGKHIQKDLYGWAGWKEERWNGQQDKIIGKAKVTVSWHD